MKKTIIILIAIIMITTAIAFCGCNTTDIEARKEQAIQNFVSNIETDGGKLISYEYEEISDNHYFLTVKYSIPNPYFYTHEIWVQYNTVSFTATKYDWDILSSYRDDYVAFTFEEKVLRDALDELEDEIDIVANDWLNSELELVSSEYVEWLECEVYTYVMTLPNGDRYEVGARENIDGFYADVIGKVEE